MHWRALGRTRILGSGFEAHDQSEAFRSCPDKILQILRNHAFVPRRVFRLIFSKSSNLDLEMGFVVHEKSYCFSAKPVWREMSVSFKHFLDNKLYTWKSWGVNTTGCWTFEYLNILNIFWPINSKHESKGEYNRSLGARLWKLPQGWKALDSESMHTMLHFTTDMHRVWFTCTQCYILQRTGFGSKGSLQIESLEKFGLLSQPGRPPLPVSWDTQN